MNYHILYLYFYLSQYIFIYKLIHWFLYQSTLTISCIELINNDGNLFYFQLIHYTCTYTYFNIFFYYKCIHWFLCQSTSTISYIKLINNDNNLLDFDFIHYTCIYTYLNIFFHYKFTYLFLYQSTSTYYNKYI